MPTYMYCCKKCGNIKEEMRKINERNNPIFCKKDNKKMELVIGYAPALRKGAGLYSLDTGKPTNSYKDD